MHVITSLNSTAKFYIYRNLHKDCFSIKYRGKVMYHLKNLYAYDVEFKVSAKGRRRVLDTKQKNVHAYVVCKSFSTSPIDPYECSVGVQYNPYTVDTFVHVLNNEPVYYANMAKLADGKLWI